MKKVILSVALLVALAGCKKDSPDEYSGHWVEENTKESKPMSLNISFNGSVYVIDEKRNHFGKDFAMQKIGQRQGDGTILVGADLGKQIMALHDGKLLYLGRTLNKSP